MTNSRRKGATGEQEFAIAVHDALGVRLVRQLDQCRGGGFDLAPEPDGGSPTAAWFRRHAIECKRHRTALPGEIPGWWMQTVRQADDTSLVPMLAYRADRQPWHVVLALDALVTGTTTDGARLTAIGTFDGLAALARN